MPLKKERKTGVQPKDMVLSKMTGFPAWPSFVMPPDMIPRAIMKAKKKTTNVCVIFIPDGDYNWMNEKSLEPLSPEKLQTRLGKLPKDKLRAKAKKRSGRTNNVADALVAANGLDFDDFMEDLARQNRDDEDPEDAPDAEDEDAEEADPQDDDADDDDIEDDDVDDEKTPEAQSAAQDAPLELSAAVKEDTEAGASSLSGDEPSELAEDPIDESSDDKHKTAQLSTDELPGRKRGRNGLGGRKEAKAIPLSPANGDKNGSPKALSEKDRQHQLWLCRIKLQRSLIQRNQPVTPKDPRDYPAPTVDELLVARIILHRLADFPVTVELLRETKIHKVLKCILKDEDLEYPDSFRLHEKCEELLQKWKTLIESLKQEKQAKLESRFGSRLPEAAQPLPDNQ